jgi:hypothetical protein
MRKMTAYWCGLARIAMLASEYLRFFVDKAELRGIDAPPP